MSNPPSKIQGEGDYESARRYNRHVGESVRKGQPKPQGETAPQAEAAGKARAKKIEQDATDAKLMERYVRDTDTSGNNAGKSK